MVNMSHYADYRRPSVHKGLILFIFLVLLLCLVWPYVEAEIPLFVFVCALERGCLLAIKGDVNVVRRPVAVEQIQCCHIGMPL